MCAPCQCDAFAKTCIAWESIARPHEMTWQVAGMWKVMGTGTTAYMALTERLEALVSASITNMTRVEEGGYSPARRWLVAWGDGDSAFAKLGSERSSAEGIRSEHAVYAQTALSCMPRLIGYDDDKGRLEPLLLIGEPCRSALGATVVRRQGLTTCWQRSTTFGLCTRQRFCSSARVGSATVRSGCESPRARPSSSGPRCAHRAG